MLLTVAPLVGVGAIAALGLFWLVANRDQPCSDSDTLALAQQWADGGELRVAAQMLRDISTNDDAVGHRALSSLALMHLRTGQVGQAVCLLSMRAGRHADNHLSDDHHVLGYAFAITGDVSAAQRFSRRNTTGRLAALCRRRDYAAAASMSVRPDLVLGPHGDRVIALLRAFALFHQQRTTSTQVISLLTAARPTSPEEFDYLLSNWLELRKFVTSHGDQLRPISEQPAQIPRVTLVRGRDARPFA